MRIAEIHLYQVDLPPVGGVYRMSDGAHADLDSTVVQIVSDTGLSGWGETCPIGPTHAAAHAPGARAALTRMAPGLVGRTVTGPAVVRRALHGLLGGHDYAKAAIDIAVHDLLGKAHGLRVCDLLGGATTDQVDSYHSLTLDEPDETARLAAEKIAEGLSPVAGEGRGPACGGRHRDDPDGVGGDRLHAAGRRRQPVTAHPRGAADRPGVRRHPVRIRAALPLHGGGRRDPGPAGPPGPSGRERRGPRRGAAGDLARDLRRIRPQGDPAGWAGCDGGRPRRLWGRSLPHTCDDSWGGDIVAAACVHVAATVHPRLLDGVWIAEPFTKVHYDPANPARVEAGRIRVPTGPGLGVVPDDGALGDPVASFG